MADLNIGLTLRNHATSVTRISWSRVDIIDLLLLAHGVTGGRPALDRDLDRLGDLFVALAALAREMAADHDSPQLCAEQLLPDLVKGAAKAWAGLTEQQEVAP